MSERQRVLHLTKKDFVEQTFRAGGKGGQNANKRDMGVRIIHPPSGARGEARDQRTQEQNRKNAFLRMAETKEFKNWLAIEHARAVGAIDDWVNQQMRPENLLIELGPLGE